MLAMAKGENGVRSVEELIQILEDLKNLNEVILKEIIEQGMLGIGATEKIFVYLTRLPLRAISPLKRERLLHTTVLVA